MRIQDIQPKDRPRERLLKHGPAALSDSELLAIILRTGTK
ncbi:MAG: JAB domain-containing protein, partial [ANME-2 cluster archaeon]